MIKRRALIVDDSRSARQILGRMLDSFGLEVDAVESAELALTYLQTTRPDVIFMDHLMPGMDGFAAVRVLKANPETATIPVLMYTSQEGEVYMSQARALGAVGVLPKTLKHSDVQNTLQQLHLIGDAAAAVSSGSHAAVQPSVAAAARPASAAANTSDTAAMASSATQARPAKAPAAEIPSELAAQQLSQRIANELKAELITQSLQIQAPRRSLLGLFVSTGTAVFVLMVGLAVLMYWQFQTQQQIAQLQETQQQVLNLLQAQATKTSLPAAMSSTSSVAVASSSTSSSKGVAVHSETQPVEYGEVPLSGARLERLRSMVETLRAQGFKGTLRVEAFTGDFCLQGNATDGYRVAEDTLAIKRCDLLGNPFADSLSVPQRQSVVFANYVASVNSNAPTTGLRIQLVDGGRQLAAPYPQQSAALTAAEWNRSAARNHRIEFTAVPSPNE